ncbi:FAD-dependent monooxygenase [Mucilaginibacter antarcticus]|uniref:FAD-dependent monooxygenase n=1 Tax=Mucilaginibacter antarcticus TaxID=1855725 RepID=UPI003645BEEC
MLITEQHTKVLIVGAGPSGLMMAAQLIRHGVQPIIIDIKQGPTNQSKALAVQARSLEIYRQLGIVERALQGGKQAHGLVLNQDGKEVASLAITDVGTQQTPYPFVHLYQQSKNERLLLDLLTQNCCPVYWDTTVVSLKQNARQVEVQLQSDQEITTLTCDYVVGADGAHSTVRKQLNIPFTGDTYANEFFLADLELNNAEVKDTQLQIFWGKAGMSAFFPLPETNSYRVIGSLSLASQAKADLQLDEVLPHIAAITGIALNVVQQNWFTTYKLHHRMADNFRKQRCFLIGDAAHIHSPVGGQGMNTGLQDAYNLGWKLAGVVTHQLKETILDSYATERMPVAKELLDTTDRAFKIIVSRSWFWLAVKKWIMPTGVRFFWKSESLRSVFFKRLSQIGISYRDSNISLHLSNSKGIKAGDRLPYLKVFDEKKQLETDLHEWCAKPGFTLIVLGKLQEIDLFTVAKWITQNYTPALNFFTCHHQKRTGRYLRFLR